MVSNSAVLRKPVPYVKEQMCPGRDHSFPQERRKVGGERSGNQTDHVICGTSSSGMAAFSSAWFKPEYFGKVYLASATFANIRNGIVWPYAIRICEKKPLKIFASVGRHDIDNFYGNWLNSNYDVACALQFRGYEHKLYITEAGHNIRLFLRFLPEGLAWLFNGTEPEMANCELATYSELLR